MPNASARLLTPRRTTILCAGSLIAFSAFVWAVRAPDLRLRYAWFGFSPMAFACKSVDPAAFAHDFPGGFENFDKSAPMLVYPLAWRLGLAPERLVPVMLGVEILALAGALIVLVRTLRPQASPAVWLLVAVLALSSNARNMSFGGYGQPFLWAKYHNIADALRILAIAAILRGWPVWAGLLAGGAFMCHPTLGLMGGAFVLACALARPRALTRRHAVGAALFIAVAAAWSLGVVGIGRTGGAPPADAEWFALTRLTSTHWYPLANGLLTFNHHAAFAPFLAFLTLAMYYVSRGAPLDATRRQAATGMVAMLGLVVLGLAISAADLSPTLVKLALHRANGLVLTVGLVYVVAGLWDDATQGAPWRTLLAGAVLASPFVSRAGFPLLLVAALASPAWLPLCSGRLGGRASLLAVVPAALAAGSVVAWTLADLLRPWWEAAYTGAEWLRLWPVPLALAALGLASLARDPLKALARGTVVLAGLGVAAVAWTLASRLPPGEQARCRSYLEAQHWARDHTPADALFLVDPALHHPGIGYGWRDYSRRSCFGFVREWLLTSWNYSWDPITALDGLLRLREFGVEPDDYAAQRPPARAFAALSKAVQTRYYAADDAWRRDVAARRGIGYFVSHRRGTALTSALPVAFENEHFIIHAAPAKDSAP